MQGLEGLSPTTPRQLRRSNLEQLAELVVPKRSAQGVSTKVRRVIITCVGNVYRARYEGRSAFVIGCDEMEARKRLRFADKEGRS
jgi:hypothetical protein